VFGTLANYTPVEAYLNSFKTIGARNLNVANDKSFRHKRDGELGEIHPRLKNLLFVVSKKKSRFSGHQGIWIAIPDIPNVVGCRQIELKAAAVVGHCGKTIVGGINEGAADWFLGLTVYDGAAYDRVFRAFRLRGKRACRQAMQKNNYESKSSKRVWLGARCHVVDMSNIAKERDSGYRARVDALKRVRVASRYS
jgi:hypothetical protein